MACTSTHQYHVMCNVTNTYYITIDLHSQATNCNTVIQQFNPCYYSTYIRWSMQQHMQRLTVHIAVIPVQQYLYRKSALVCVFLANRRKVSLLYMHFS